MTKIAFLGLGAMGQRMVKQLLNAGHDVVVYNRSRAAAEAALTGGAKFAETPKKAAEGQDFVIAMVRDDAASEAVWTGSEGALASLGKDAVAIESSTLTPSWARQLGARVAERGASFIDAPVVGTRPQAEARKLVYLVGGEAPVIERAQDVLLAMGQKVHRAGPIGAGMALKLAVNALFGVQVAALAELLAMLRREGIQGAEALEALGALPVTSPALVGAGGLMVARNFAPMFPIALVEKDLRYAVERAEALEGELPVTGAVRAVFQRAVEEGFGGENIVGVARVFD